MCLWSQKYLVLKTAVDIWLSDIAITLLPDLDFLSLNWLPLGDDCSDPFQFSSRYPPTLLGTLQLLTFLGKYVFQIRLGYYMQHTAMDYQLRSEKLLNSSHLPNYEECVAKSRSPELSPTNIFPKCH